MVAYILVIYLLLVPCVCFHTDFDYVCLCCCVWLADVNYQFVISNLLFNNISYGKLKKLVVIWEGTVEIQLKIIKTF